MNFAFRLNMIRQKISLKYAKLLERKEKSNFNSLISEVKMTKSRTVVFFVTKWHKCTILVIVLLFMFLRIGCFGARNSFKRRIRCTYFCKWCYDVLNAFTFHLFWHLFYNSELLFPNLLNALFILVLMHITWILFLIVFDMWTFDRFNFWTSHRNYSFIKKDFSDVTFFIYYFYQSFKIL